MRFHTRYTGEAQQLYQPHKEKPQIIQRYTIPKSNVKMEDTVTHFPKAYPAILKDTQTIGFDQLSDGKLGTLLAVLCASKQNGSFLELGTGTGLCTSWMLHGMCNLSKLITVDNDESLVSVAKKHLESDTRVKFIVKNGEDVINQIPLGTVDLIFADTWPGKYNHVEETLNLLKKGGLYIIDDMRPQPNWPNGHQEKANNLIDFLSKRDDLTTTKMCWATGLVVCVKNV